MVSDGADTETEILQWMEKIQAAVRQREWRDVEKLSLLILDKNQNHPETMMYLGIARAAQGFEPEGENLLLASLTLNPNNKEAYYNLGVIVLNQGRCLLAEDAFRHGLKLDPLNHALNYQLGCVLERLCRDNEAIEAFQRALDNQPNEDEPDFKREAATGIERIQAKIDET